MTTSDLSKPIRPAYSVAQHLAPGACTVPGHEGADATVFTVTPATGTADAAEEMVLAVTHTPWRTEYTYPTDDDGLVTVTDPAALPVGLGRALSELRAAAPQLATTPTPGTAL
jgi:hypothetical protein